MTTAAGERLLYRVEEAARMLGIGRSKMWELVARSEIESVKIDDARRIPAQALADYVNRLRRGRPDAA